MEIVTHQNKQVLKNFLALGLIQATNFLIPLFTLPYLVRTIGLDNFGNVSYALTIMSYTAILIDYGFSMSATRQVAIYRDNPEKLSVLFSTITVARILLFLVSALLIISLICIVKRFEDNSTLYIYGLVFPLGLALMPTWLYQGLELMRRITYLNAAAKLLTIILLFYIVKSGGDYVYVLGIYGVANTFSGIYSITEIVKKFKIKFILPNLHELKEQYKSGFNLFFTSITLAIVNNSTLLILALFIEGKSLGSYSLAEKIIMASWQVLATFSSAIYPTLCRLTLESHNELRSFIKRVFIPFSFCVFIGCMLISFFAEDIIALIAKVDDSEAVNILRIMALVPFIVCLNIPAYQTQLAYSITRENTRIYTYAAVLNLFLCTTLSYYWGTRGAAVSMLVAQIFITVSLYFILEVKYKHYSLLGLAQKRLTA